ncbi:MAG: hypothetical protein K8T25_07305 [Planctomycetia bacterium]|nr:hypothetical protein [Planctomycetia bacterium]
MFEKKHQPLLPPPKFAARMARSFGVAILIIAVSLGLGAAGYHFFGKLGWLDALYNASMILTGMGPVDKMDSDAAKWFGTFYALYSGVAFLTTMAVLAAPVFHRILHTFNLDSEDEGDDDDSKSQSKQAKKKGR